MTTLKNHWTDITEVGHSFEGSQWRMIYPIVITSNLTSRCRLTGVRYSRLFLRLFDSYHSTNKSDSCHLRVAIINLYSNYSRFTLSFASSVPTHFIIPCFTRVYHSTRLGKGVMRVSSDGIVFYRLCPWGIIPFHVGIQPIQWQRLWEQNCPNQITRIQSSLTDQWNTYTIEVTLWTRLHLSTSFW